MIEIPTKGKVDDIKKAILSGNPHIEYFIADYFDSFFEGFLSYKIDYMTLPQNESFADVVVQGIDDISLLKKDFISFLKVIIKSQEYCKPDIFIDFFERLLQFYSDNGINLYTGDSINSYAVDNYRFFNQDMFLNFVSTLVEYKRFDVLSGVISARLIVASSGYYREAESVNYIRFREYNYTLNEFVNKKYPQKRISVTADYINKYASDNSFENLIKADILLYYLSIIYPGDNFLDRIWYPELSFFNHQTQILPKLISKRYFDSCKCLFGVNTVEEYKKLLLKLTDSIQQMNNGVHGVPAIKIGLMYDSVASVD